MNPIKNLFFIFCLFFSAKGLTQVYYFEVCFTDKNNSIFSLSNPTSFISDKALERRSKNNATLSNDDLPVNSFYLDSLRQYLKVEAISKWFNLCALSTTDSAKIDSIKKYPFVKSIKYIGMDINGTGKKSSNKFSKEFELESINYGKADKRIKQVNGNYLHEQNNLGEGKLIAVLDGGFINVNNMMEFGHLFSNNQIVFQKNLVSPSEDVYRFHEHGTMVLSILAGISGTEYLGSAPNANYLLLLTEDVSQENPIEEYYWINGVEMADSAGADVINSSLGYYDFDSPEFNHKVGELTGDSLLITKAANKAFEKGILVFNSAGNEGNNSWKYLVFPADAKNVITVGGVSSDSTYSYFSSLGYNISLNVKPNVAALASSTYVLEDEGIGSYSNGTSFSSPLLCGLGTCLWQALPNKSNQEIKTLIEKSAHQHTSPDQYLGYGIPNFKSILIQEEENEIGQNSDVILFPNPSTKNLIQIRFLNESFAVSGVKIYNFEGKCVSQFLPNNLISQSSRTWELQYGNLASGIYLLEIQTNVGNYLEKISVLNELK